MNEICVWNTDGMILVGKIEQLGWKIVPVPLCASQIPHDLTEASKLRDWQVTA